VTSKFSSSSTESFNFVHISGQDQAVGDGSGPIVGLGEVLLLVSSLYLQDAGNE
jgi:hypothetical protein